MSCECGLSAHPYIGAKVDYFSVLASVRDDWPAVRL